LTDTRPTNELKSQQTDQQVKQPVIQSKCIPNLSSFQKMPQKRNDKFSSEFQKKGKGTKLENKHPYIV